MGKFDGNGHAQSIPRVVSQNGINLIKQFEQLRLVPYRDVAGHWTIGYGHLILSDEHFVLIAPQQANALLEQDLSVVERAINTYVKVPLSQNEFDALASFTFNEGVEALRTSTLLRKLNACNYHGAASELLLWDRAFIDGEFVREPGLTRRRQTECQLFLRT